MPSSDNLLLIENLSPLITNERLSSAFTSFGSVKYGYIIVNENHDSTGYGLISFNSKETAIIATKRCEDMKFVITRYVVLFVIFKKSFIYTKNFYIHEFWFITDNQ